MNATERELWEALVELLCCPAFNGQVFMQDSASHRAWTLARDVAERHRPLPEQEKANPAEGEAEAVDNLTIPAFLKRQAE
ncbi:MAG: hypothetical protein KJP06_04220 [Deltaproteobacteria bacterium]|nr:hypothetical protein [Deltaproteobacteria bacterium]